MNEKKQVEPKWMKARSTAQARRAIAEFVNDNSENLSEWLQRVAYGIPKADADGNVIRDAQGSVVYVLKPDPGAAIKAVSDIAEYHLPRLTRTEATVVQRTEGPFDPTTMTTEDLKRYVMEQLGHTDQGIIDVVPERETTFAERQEGKPDWLK